MSQLLKLVVSDARQLTPRAMAFKLSLADGNELPLASAGSHLKIPVTLPNGQQDWRCYSLCHTPLQRNYYEIAVLHEAEGSGGSAFIHREFKTGFAFECELPANHFALHSDSSPSILIAGGIGITPIIAMARTLSLRGRRFILHYAGRSENEMAFLAELQKEFPRQLQTYPVNQGKRLDLMHAMTDAPSNAQFYICGPNRMINESESCARALGIARDRMQYERFTAEKFVGDKPVILELSRSNKIIQASGEQSLLMALRDAGVKVNFDCCVGECATCAVQVLEGEPEHRDHVLSDDAKSNGAMCVCVSRAKGEKLVLDL